MLEEIGDAKVSINTWANWHTAAKDAVDGRMRFASGVGVFASLIPAAVGLAVFEGYVLTVVVYSPLAALVAVPLARRWYVHQRFSSVSSEMRALLVPRLLDQAPEPMLLHLARFGGGAKVDEMKIVRVRHEATCVTIEVKRETQPGPWPSSWSIPAG